MEHKISTEIFQKAEKYIPGGVNSPVRAFKSVNRKAPIFACKGKGARIWDEDGNEYMEKELEFGMKMEMSILTISALGVR